MDQFYTVEVKIFPRGEGSTWVNVCWVCAAGLSHFSKIQLVVYYQRCILIGWATTRLLCDSPLIEKSAWFLVAKKD